MLSDNRENNLNQRPSSSQSRSSNASQQQKKQHLCHPLPPPRHRYRQQPRPALFAKSARLLLTEHRQRERPSLIQRGPSWLQLELGINELSGQAGSGKTQIALSACLQAAAAAMELTSQQQQQQQQQPAPRAIYIALGTSNLSKIAQRLEDMAKASSQYDATVATTVLLQSILVKAVMNQDNLSQLLHQELPTLLERCTAQCKMIVLDDIATLFRGKNFDATTTAAGTSAPAAAASSLSSSYCYAQERSSALFQIAAQLKQLSEQYRIPILVINQVTASSSSSHNRSVAAAAGGGEWDAEQPALGLSWAQCVNHAYTCRRRKQDPYGDQAECVRTIAPTRSSCYASNQVMTFTIQASGVVPSSAPVALG